MATHRVIGKPVAQLDGPQKVTGATVYGVDVAPPGALWVCLLHSTEPSARIVCIDTTKARALPGVRAVLTGDDVRGMRTGATYKDEPLLAWDVVRFVGEKVAAVCADDRQIGERALALIEVEYAPLPAVFDAREAARPDAPILHAEFGDYEGVAKLGAPSNVYGHRVLEGGDLEAGFAQADVIVEHTYTTPRSHQLYLEPHACVVLIDDVGDDAGTVQVWAATQDPATNRDEMARVLGLTPERIVFNVVDLGGSYGVTPISDGQRVEKTVPPHSVAIRMNSFLTWLRGSLARKLRSRRRKSCSWRRRTARLTKHLRERRRPGLQNVRSF